MWSLVPPAGNPIILESDTGDSFEEKFDGWSLSFYQSGTAALAAALAAAIGPVVTGRTPEDKPEVLVPAYGCPDIVSAVLFAGAVPVPVDFEERRPWLDPADVVAAITPHTVAIVAAHLLGVRERMADLCAVAARHGLAVIEDSAQYLPRRISADAWSGDLVVLSFGRGKPLSLLDGGAVLVRDGSGARRPKINPPEQGTTLLGAKRRAYNALLRPMAYGLLSKLPFLELGTTVFRPLGEIGSAQASTLSLLPANMQAYCRRSPAVAEALRNTLGTPAVSGHITDLPAACNVGQDTPLQRYPVLVHDGRAERLCTSLQRAGIGATRFYGRVLADIDGVRENGLIGRDAPHATAFAAELVTIPCHDGVTAAHVETVAGVVADIVG